MSNVKITSFSDVKITSFPDLSADNGIVWVTQGGADYKAPAQSSIDAFTVLLRDENGMAALQNLQLPLEQIIASSTPIQMDVTSAAIQVLTGTELQSFALPDATTLPLYANYFFANNSTNQECVAAVSDYDFTDSIVEIKAQSYAFIYLVDNSTEDGVWLSVTGIKPDNFVVSVSVDDALSTIIQDDGITILIPGQTYVLNNSTTNNGVYMGTAEAVITPTVATQVSVIVTNLSDVTSINAAISPAWCEVEAISSNTPINPNVYVTKASRIGNAGVEVILGNLRARIPTSGNRSLRVATVSGTYSVYGSCTYAANGGNGAARIDATAPVNVTTTFAYLNPGNNFLNSGDMCIWIIMDVANNISWRLQFIIGAGYNNNMISIEQLV